MKACIVCGEPAGSKEHVWPASMGGRRTNSGIYCTDHDNGYGPLVDVIARQIDFLNAYLGVRNDHTKEQKTIQAIDPISGFPIKISAEAIEFTESRVISQSTMGNSTEFRMAFPDRQTANAWVANLENQGYTVDRQGKAIEQQHFLGRMDHSRAFGGPMLLGAIAYIVQTFFAQEFPEAARSGALADFIAYTQATAKLASLQRPNSDASELADAQSRVAAALARLGGTIPASWDFSPASEASPNAFAFGHRVIVGVDASDGQLYGRLSLFSALNFVVHLGTAFAEAPTKEVRIDIDPLAERPPNDIIKTNSSQVLYRVSLPLGRSEHLAQSVADGMPGRLLNQLLERLNEHQLITFARTMATRLKPLPTLPVPEQRALIATAIDEGAQQVWRLASYVVEEFKKHLNADGMRHLDLHLDQLIAHDSQSLNGLSTEAEETLRRAKVALIQQMEEDFAAGLLDEAQIAELIGRGGGMQVVGRTILRDFY